MEGQRQEWLEGNDYRGSINDYTRRRKRFGGKGKAQERLEGNVHAGIKRREERNGEERSLALMEEERKRGKKRER